MSGIFGLFMRDDRPLALARLQTMQTAMAYWGPDGHGIWSDNSIGLGQLLLHNTPEARYERLPR
jgi:asparagine synthetase B (glutamine-hydrolysing)